MTESAVMIVKNDSHKNTRILTTPKSILKNTSNFYYHAKNIRLIFKNNVRPKKIATFFFH